MLDILSKYPSNFITIIYQIQKKFIKIYTQTITKIFTPYHNKNLTPISWCRVNTSLAGRSWELMPILACLYCIFIVILQKASCKNGISKMNKPVKVYINNPSLIRALAPGHVNYGTVRETFFLISLPAVKMPGY